MDIDRGGKQKTKIQGERQRGRELGRQEEKNKGEKWRERGIEKSEGGRHSRRDGSK
jgi:hypothetical protein